MKYSKSKHLFDTAIGLFPCFFTIGTLMTWLIPMQIIWTRRHGVNAIVMRAMGIIGISNNSSRMEIKIASKNHRVKEGTPPGSSYEVVVQTPHPPDYIC